MPNIDVFPIATTFLVSFLVTFSVDAREGDAKAIEQVFLSYRAAILAGEGTAAAGLLSQSTYDYYDHARQMALSGDARTVQDLPLSDQVQILLYRIRVPQAALESLSPLGLIAHSIEQGWIAKQSVEKIQPGEVKVRADEAIIHVVIDGEDRGPAFRFAREARGWRLDLVPVMRATDSSLRSALQREGMGESDFILAVVERAVDDEVGIEAWIPLRERIAEDVEE